LVEGTDPDPVVLDSELRLPPSSRLLTNSRTAHIFCSEPFDEEHANTLSDAGASIHPVTKTDQGLLDLHAILTELQSLGYRALMVEGGARVITEFLGTRSVDWLVLTVAPILLGGLNVPIADHALDIWSPVELDLRGTAHFGQDLVIWGEPSWQVE
jgi:riboflavin biosynthesis pyrimidine reductase